MKKRDPNAISAARVFCAGREWRDPHPENYREDPLARASCRVPDVESLGFVGLSEAHQQPRAWKFDRAYHGLGADDDE